MTLIYVQNCYQITIMRTYVGTIMAKYINKMFYNEKWFYCSFYYLYTVYFNVVEIFNVIIIINYLVGISLKVFFKKIRIFYIKREFSHKNLIIYKNIKPQRKSVVDIIKEERKRLWNASSLMSIFCMLL